MYNFPKKHLLKKPGERSTTPNAFTLGDTFKALPAFETQLCVIFVKFSLSLVYMCTWHLSNSMIKLIIAYLIIETADRIFTVAGRKLIVLLTPPLR
jgi:hypothetical protein